MTYIPIKTLDEAKNMMLRDIERIYKAIDSKKFCFQALEQVNLYGEYFMDPEQLNISFERVAKKLGDTMMIAPETVPGLYSATHRYGFQWVTFMYNDYPEIF